MKKFKLLLLVVVFFVAAAASVTDPDDAATLQALSKAIGGDRALGWAKKSDPCTWDLVTCTDGRVTAIQIGNKSLHEVGKLTALTRLELQNNLFSGPLPSSLANLTALQSLLLHNNQFSSVASGFFAGLSSLESAFLDNNPLEPWPIPPSLKDCGALVNFSANSANVTGGLPDFFATSFPSLNHVGLAFNSLSGPNPASGPSGSTTSRGPPCPEASRSSAECLGSRSSGCILMDSPGRCRTCQISPTCEICSSETISSLASGVVPQSLISLKTLGRLALTNNLLQGPVPVFANPIKELDLDPMSERFCLMKPGDCDPRVNALLSIVKSFDYPKKFAGNWKGNDPCDGWLG